METKWDLTALYDSFESETFHSDLKQIDQHIVAYNQFADTIFQSNTDTTESLMKYLEFQLKFSDLFQHLFSYCSLTLSANMTDKNAQKYSDILNEKSSSLAKSGAILNHWIGSLAQLPQLLENNDQLKEHEFYFKEI